MSNPQDVPVPPPSGPLRLDGAFPRADLDDWRSAAAKTLPADVTLESLVRHTPDGLPVPVLGHASPVEGRHTPDVRPAGVRPAATLADAPAWDNRLCVLGDDPAAASTHVLSGLAGGVTSLEIDVGDGPGGLGIDALDEVLRGVHLDMVGLSLRTGDDVSGALDAVRALLEERGIAPGDCPVELGADPVGRLVRHGDLDGGLDAAHARLADVATRARATLPGARVVAVDAVIHHAAGASSCQELTAALATATGYLDALLDAGMTPADALDTMSFRLALDADIVAGIVKLRALERLWRHTLASAGLPVVRPRVIVETSRRHQSTLAPWVNHLRNVAACTAAAIGGADVVIAHPHDRVDGRRLDGDDVVADRVARNLPILLAAEGGLLAVDDAAGGAHAIESLTQASVEAVWSSLAELQDRGGLVAALGDGRWQADIARVHAARVARLAAGDAVRIGVNRFRHDGVAVAAADVTPPPEADSRLHPVREARAFERLAPDTAGSPSTGASA